MLEETLEGMTSVVSDMVFHFNLDSTACMSGEYWSSNPSSR